MALIEFESQLDDLDFEAISLIQEDKMDYSQLVIQQEEKNVLTAATTTTLPENEVFDNQNLPKADYAVDHLDLTLLSPLLRLSDIQTRNMFGLVLETEMKKKYYRFDNKMLQCFPNCSRFPDVREARMLGYDHRSEKRTQAWCSNAVEARLFLPKNISLDTVHVVGRFLSATPDVTTLPESDTPVLDVGETTNFIPTAQCVKGEIQEFGTDSFGRRIINIKITPNDAWYINLTLPRHRRNASIAAEKVPLFVFEVLVLLQTNPSAYMVCSRSVTSPFEISSVRTLIREVLAYRQNAEVEDKRSKSSVRKLSTNYSNTVHRIRLSEEKKKKDNFVIKVLPNRESSPVPLAFIPVVPDWMKNDAFQLPEIADEEEQGRDLIVPLPEFNADPMVVEDDDEFIP